MKEFSPTVTLPVLWRRGASLALVGGDKHSEHIGMCINHSRADVDIKVVEFIELRCPISASAFASKLPTYT